MKYYSYLVAAVVASLILGISSLFLSVRTAVTLEQMSRQISALKSPISGELAPSNKPPGSHELSTTPASIPAGTDISTWNTYDDKPIGIHFKYPKSWDLLGPKSPTYPLLDLTLGNPTCSDCDQPPAMTVKVWPSVYSFDTHTKNLNAKNLADLLAK